MYSLILKITHSQAAKDSISIIRGLYKVAEGGMAQSSGSTVRQSSWMDPPKHISDSDHKIPVIQQQNPNSNINQLPSSHFSTKTDESLKQNNLHHSKMHQQTNTVSESLQKQEKRYLHAFQEHKRQQIFNPEESSIPETRIGRIFQFGKLGMNLATASLFAGKNKDETYYQGVAEKISEQLCKMRGAPLKLAQMLSIQQNDLIPAPVRKAFQKARETAHVIPKHEVEFMMKKSLGEQWRQKFKEFPDKPFASASIGQVHRAKLPDGKEVAVKVQYHAVKESINSDINNLQFLMKLPKIFPKTMYMEKILKKTREQLMLECDYVRQKNCQQVYWDCLQESLGKEESKFYKVPRIVEELTTNQILTSEYVHGIKMKDIEEVEGYSQELKDELGRRIMQLTFKELFEMGIMQSDPNPSNFTYNHETDTLNLYDFGATHIYRPEFLKEYYRIINGSRLDNEQQIWDASIKTGFVTGEQNNVMKKSHIESIKITGEPLRYQGMYDFGKQEITKRIYKTIPLMLKNRLKPPPEQVYSLHRKLSGSYLACIRLGARVNCFDIFEKIKFETLASQQRYKSRIVGSSQ